MRTAAIKIAVIMLVSFAIYAMSGHVQAMSKPMPTPDPNYCGENGGPYGLSAYVSSAIYDKGQTVDFCMVDDGRIPLFIGPEEHPWVVIGPKGDIVFHPHSVPPTTEPAPSWRFYDSWNQTNDEGKQVRPGQYTIQFIDQIYVSPSVTVSVR